MRRSVKKLLIAGLCLVAVLVAGFLTVPSVISSEAVRTSLLERGREITGRKMRFSGDPRILFKPFLGIEINDVIVADASSDDIAEPLLEMPKLVAEISFSNLLRGQIRINDFQFIRPRFHLSILPSGKTNWSFADGQVWKTLEEARILKEENPTGSEPEMARLTNVPLGTFSVSDGMVFYRNAETGREESITNFNGKLVWPDTRSGWQFRGNGIWRGDVFTIENSIDRPIMLMAGGGSPMDVTIGSEPVNLQFEGEANRFADFYVNGKINASSPSLRRLINLAGGEASTGSSFAGFSADGRISGTLSQLQLDDAAFSLDGNRSAGNLRVSITESSKFRITGTLASSSTKLDPYLSSWSISEMTQDPMTGMPLLSEAEFDIRLSSAQMTLGDYQIGEFAGAFMTRDGQMIIDIGNATIGSGTAVGKIEATVSGETQSFGAELNLSGANTDDFRPLLADLTIRPGGTGDVSLKLKSTGNSLAELIANAKGDFLMTMAKGNLIGMDFSQLMRGIEEPRANTENIQISSGSDQTPVQQLVLKARVNSGVAWIRESGFTTADHKARLDGKADLRSGNLALWGRLFRENPNQQVENIDQFFIGGTLSGPLFMPEIVTGN